MARECYYVSLKSLGRKDEAPPSESSWPNKLGTIGAPEAVMLLSASAEEHGRPSSQPVMDIIEVHLDSGCPKHLVCVGKALTPPMKDAITSLNSSTRTFSHLNRRKC